MQPCHIISLRSPVKVRLAALALAAPLLPARRLEALKLVVKCSVMAWLGQSAAVCSDYVSMWRPIWAVSLWYSQVVLCAGAASSTGKGNQELACTVDVRGGVAALAGAGRLPDAANSGAAAVALILLSSHAASRCLHAMWACVGASLHLPVLAGCQMQQMLELQQLTAAALRLLSLMQLAGACLRCGRAWGRGCTWMCPQAARCCRRRSCSS